MHKLIAAQRKMTDLGHQDPSMQKDKDKTMRMKRTGSERHSK